MQRFSTLKRIKGVLLLSCVSACGFQGQDSADPSAVWLNIVYEEISASPELATRIGTLEGNDLIAASGQIADQSSAAHASLLARRLEYLEMLEAIDRSEMTAGELSALDSLLEAYRNYAALSAFGHGDVTVETASPYAVTHMSGAWLELPAKLRQTTRIETLADAQSYLTILSGISSALRDNQQLLKSEANAGIKPPIAVIDAALTRLDPLLAMAPEQSEYLTILRDDLEMLETRDAEVETALINQARDIYTTSILPELQSLRATLADLRSGTQIDAAAGLSAIPHGADWYGAALKLQTGYVLEDAGLAMNTALERIAQIDRNLDRVLKILEMPEGTVAERLQPLLADAERPVLSADIQLRIDLETDLSSILELMRRRLHLMFESIPATTPEVVISTASAPITDKVTDKTAREAAVSESWNALRFDDRRSLLLVEADHLIQTPGLLLPAQLYHAGYPGSALRKASERPFDVQPIDRLFENVGFDDGWAFYALDLTQEFNAYDEAPSALLGLLLLQRLQTALFYADASMHLRGWSVEETARFLTETTGYPEDQMREEALRIAAMPGRVSAAYLGRNQILALREKAEFALANEFSLAEFHAIILNSGSRPLGAVASDIDRWIASKAIARAESGTP